MSKSQKPPTNTARETEDPATAVAAEAAERGSTTVATEGLAATPVEQPAAARTGKLEAASPVPASTAAEGSRTTAAAAVEEPVAAAAAPEAISAEEAAARAATVPEEVDTATKRSAQTRLPHSPRYGSKNCLSCFFIQFILCKLHSENCHFTVYSVLETVYINFLV
jgi:hypothetical protein